MLRLLDIILASILLTVGVTFWILLYTTGNKIYEDLGKVCIIVSFISAAIGRTIIFIYGKQKPQMENNHKEKDDSQRDSSLDTTKKDEK